MCIYIDICPLFYAVHVTLLSNHRESADCRSELLSYIVYKQIIMHYHCHYQLNVEKCENAKREKERWETFLMNRNKEIQLSFYELG